MPVFDELSFREKSALASLLAVLLVFGSYFADLVFGGGPDDLSSMLGMAIGIVVTLIIVQVLMQTLLAAFDRDGASAPPDERDLQVNSRAARVSYAVLSAGVLIALARILIQGNLPGYPTRPDVILFEIANLLLAAFILSELAHYGAQLWYYRRGV